MGSKEARGPRVVSPEHQLRFFVKLPSGQTRSILSSSSATVASVLAEVSRSLDGHSSELRLLFGGRQLHKESSLGACDVRRDSILHVTYRLLGGMPGTSGPGGHVVRLPVSSAPSSAKSPSVSPAASPRGGRGHVPKDPQMKGALPDLEPSVVMTTTKAVVRKRTSFVIEGPSHGVDTESSIEGVEHQTSHAMSNTSTVSFTIKNLQRDIMRRQVERELMDAETAKDAVALRDALDSAKNLGVAQDKIDSATRLLGTLTGGRARSKSISENLEMKKVQKNIWRGNLQDICNRHEATTPEFEACLEEGKQHEDVTVLVTFKDAWDAGAAKRSRHRKHVEQMMGLLGGALTSQDMGMMDKMADIERFAHDEPKSSKHDHEVSENKSKEGIAPATHHKSHREESARSKALAEEKERLAKEREDTRKAQEEKQKLAKERALQEAAERQRKEKEEREALRKETARLAQEAAKNKAKEERELREQKRKKEREGGDLPRQVSRQRDEVTHSVEDSKKVPEHPTGANGDKARNEEDRQGVATSSSHKTAEQRHAERDDKQSLAATSQLQHQERGHDERKGPSPSDKSEEREKRRTERKKRDKDAQLKQRVEEEQKREDESALPQEEKRKVVLTKELQVLRQKEESQGKDASVEEMKAKQRALRLQRETPEEREQREKTEERMNQVQELERMAFEDLRERRHGLEERDLERLAQARLDRMREEAANRVREECQNVLDAERARIEEELREIERKARDEGFLTEGERSAMLAGKRSLALNELATRETEHQRQIEEALQTSMAELTAQQQQLDEAVEKWLRQDQERIEHNRQAALKELDLRVKRAVEEDTEDMLEDLATTLSRVLILDYSCKGARLSWSHQDISHTTAELYNRLVSEAGMMPRNYSSRTDLKPAQREDLNKDPLCLPEDAPEVVDKYYEMFQEAYQFPPEAGRKNLEFSRHLYLVVEGAQRTSNITLRALMEPPESSNLKCAGVCVVKDAFVALFGMNVSTGIWIDVGHDGIRISPVHAGDVLQAATRTLTVSWEEVCRIFFDHCRTKGMLEVSATNKREGMYTTAYSGVIFQYAKGGVAFHYMGEFDQASEHHFNSFTHSDRYVDKHGKTWTWIPGAQYAPFELYFKPEFLSFWQANDRKSMMQRRPGLADLVAEAIMACEPALRPIMARSIYLGGEFGCLPGLRDRLHMELAHRLPPVFPIKVTVADPRPSAAILKPIDTSDQILSTNDRDRAHPRMRVKESSAMKGARIFARSLEFRKFCLRQNNLGLHAEVERLQGLEDQQKKRTAQAPLEEIRTPMHR